MNVARAGALVAALCAASVARADGWAGAVGLTTDKVFRGVSQSAGRAAALADLHYRTDTGWAVGAGVAWLDRPGASAELTASASRSWQLDDAWTAQLGVVHYDYAGGSEPRYRGYDEIGATLGWRGRAFLSLSASPNTTGYRMDGSTSRRRAVAGELTWQEPLAGGLAVDAGIGYYEVRASGGGYTYGSLGLSWGNGPVQLYLSYITSRAGARGLASPGAAGDRWVASGLWAF